MAQATTPSGAVVDTSTGALVSGPTNSSPNSSSSGASTGNTDFINQLQQKLLGQSDIISSENTNLENKINDAIKNIQTGQQASAQAITSSYDRQIADAAKQGQNQITSFNESTRGYATNTAALRQLTEDTSKQLKDLEQRKQELILQGQAAAAGQVSQLQIQAIQFHQQAQQQVFANLLQMGNFAQQQQQNSLAQRSQDFQEQSAKATIALQYGINVNPGDTLQDVINRAKPMASQKQQLELAKLQSDILKNKAEAAKAYNDAAAGGTSSSSDVDILSRGALNSNGASLALIKNPDTYAKVVTRMAAMQKEDVASAVSGYKSEGLNKVAAQRDARNTYKDNPQLLAIANAEIDKQYGNSFSESNAGAGSFVAPGSAAAFKNSKFTPASPDAVKALQDSLLGTSFAPRR